METWLQDHAALSTQYCVWCFLHEKSLETEIFERLEAYGLAGKKCDLKPAFGRFHAFTMHIF